MQSIALEVGIRDKHLELFMTGLFSSIDVLLNKRMEEILEELPFEETVKDALLGKKNQLSKIMDLVVHYEKSNWIEFESEKEHVHILQIKFMELYIEALKWAMMIDN